MTHNWKKITLLLVLVLSASLSFSEELFSFTIGAGLFSEQFPEDHYSRGGPIKNSYNITWRHYPEKFFLGLFAGMSYAQTTNDKTTEQNEREHMGAREYTGRDLRLSFGPSYKWNISKSFFIPFSLGPVFSFYSEKAVEHLLLGDNYLRDTTYHYTALSGGIKGDMALIWVPSPWFFVKGGFSMEWIFFRGEAGQMRMNYRTTNNDVLTGVRYSDVYPAFYVGAGLRIGS